MGSDTAADVIAESAPPETEEPVGFWAAVAGAQDFANNVIDSTEAVFLGGQDTIADVASTGGETIEGVAGEANETARRIANPFNLAGLAFGGTLGAVLVGTVAAVAADQILLGGAGRAALVGAVSGGRRRR